MTPVWAVIRREYLQRVRSKWFVLSTLGVPVLILAAVFLPAFFGAGGERGRRTVLLVDETDVLAERVAAALDETGLLVERLPAGEELGALSRRVTEGEAEGVVVLDGETLERGRVRYLAGSAPSPVRRVALRQAVVQAALEHRLEGEGVDIAALLSGGELDVQVLGSEGEGMQDPAFLSVYGGTFLLYMVVLLYAVSVMRSVLEEKTNRIVEVVISSMRPWHLMLGKILGVGAVGLTQLLVWLALGTFIAAVGLPALVAARPELARLENVEAFLPGLRYLGLFLVFFLGGYFIFSSLYAAVGAMCNTDQEAQQAQTPLVFLLVAPVVLLVGVMQAPSTPASVALSLVPFFSPILMFARAALGAAPAWQVGLSVVLMGLTVVGVAWVAGRIYRTGILMAGKRPTLPELWRWVREA